MLDRYAASRIDNDRVGYVIDMFQHIYDHYILLETQDRFRSIVWNKMKEIDEYLAKRLNKILNSRPRHDATLRQSIKDVLYLDNIIKRIRERYYPNAN